MISYALSAFVGFVLVFMGCTAFSWGMNIFVQNKKSKSARKFLGICSCVLFWNLGYAWMGASYGEDFAYIPRAVALFFVFAYMYCVLDYVVYLAQYPVKKFIPVISMLAVAYFISWFFVIQKDAVSFVMAPWGYWYYSKASWMRILQFLSTAGALFYFYYLLAYWKRNTTGKRNLHIISRLKWFGVILVSGYTFDTIIPSFFHIVAFPGTCFATFFCALLIYILSKSNRTLGTTVNNVAEYVFQDVEAPIMIFNEKDKLEVCNKKTLSIFGLELEKAVGTDMKSVMDYFDEDGVAHLKEKNVYYKMSATRVDDQYGDLLYTILFLTDVTYEKSVMNTLAESRREADAANRAKTFFLANMSHEIRTPMNAIIGMSDIILQDNTLDEENRQNVINIKTAGVNLMSIVNDILDISKIESGKYELVEEEYDFPSLIYDVQSLTRVRTAEKQLGFELSINSDIPCKLLGDVKRVRQILINLLGNAVKYTEKGCVSFRISWNYDVLKPVLVFDIEDTGIGIKEEDYDRIFDSFNQVDTRKNRNIQGTGLGLAISKQLVTLMGGTITVSSVYGEGSCFTVRIHQKIKEYLKIGESIAQALEGNTYKNNQQKEEFVITPRPYAKVLIVDDMKANLLVAKGIMKPYQMQIDTALSGKEALEMVQKKDYDIVFMDHMMPELDGVDTTALIRKLPEEKYKKLVIIALTANTLEEYKELFLQNGMQDFIGKPIQRIELDKVLQKWLPVKEVTGQDDK